MEDVVGIINCIEQIVWNFYECPSIPNEEYTNDVYYLRDFQTLHLKLPRQCGMTTAAIRWSLEKTRRNKRVAFVSFSDKCTQNIRERFVADIERTHIDFYSIHQIKLSMNEYDYVILDPGSYMIADFWEQVRKFKISFKKNVIILVLG